MPEAPINILIVDDEPKNLMVLELVLNDPGYRIVRAGSADEALLALVAEEFALLILDVRMPGMTGFELAQMVKERKKTAHVPIIFLTAFYNEDQHVLEGYGSGAVDYLHKPINPAILRSKVAVFAQLYRMHRENAEANRALVAEIAERSRAEERLRETVQELEAFSYSIAHDMRAPLRSMQGFSEILETEHTAQLDATGLDFLRRISCSARRMDALILDILNYSKVGNG
ncbi:MAG: response regulator, partial [Polaromonas sp.]|nr:response regulator [Polaromonas sp.]